MKAFLPSTLGVCAIVLGTAANVYCETIKFVNSDNLVLYAGPWSYRTRDTSEWIDGSTFVYTTCRYYNYLENDLGFSFTVDATTRAVWSFSIITPVVGALVLVGACLAPCMSFGDARWKAIGCMLITLSLFQGLTLMIESSSICNDNPVLQYIETNPGLVGTFPDSCGEFKSSEGRSDRALARSMSPSFSCIVYDFFLVFLTQLSSSGLIFLACRVGYWVYLEHYSCGIVVFSWIVMLHLSSA